jgi:hypothetical protein
LEAKRALQALGRSVAIFGKHRRMVVEPQYAESAEFREFWAKPRRGEREKSVNAPLPTAAKNGHESDRKEF